MGDWISDNKGAGAWDFQEQKNKWGYLNNPRWTDTPGPAVSYDGREDEEPQVWGMNLQRRDAGDSKHHIPCGHWHKDGLEELTAFPIVSYIEMHNYGLIESQTNPFGMVEATRTINTNDFDGNVTYWFEVLGNNHGTGWSGTYYPATESYTVYLMNTEYTVIYAQITFEPNTPDPENRDVLERKRVAFTPPAGETQFSLYFPADKQISPEDPTGTSPMIGAIRIIIKQENATKSMVQVPLQCVSDWGGISRGSFYTQDVTYCDYDEPAINAWSLFYNGGIWLYEAEKLSNISKFVFETVAGSSGGLNVPDECQPLWSYYSGTPIIEWGIALFTTAGVMVPGTSIMSTETDGTSTFELDIWLDVPGDIAAGNYKVGFYRKTLGGDEWVYSYPTYGYYYSVPADPYEGHVRWYVKGNPFWEEEIFGGLVHRLWWQEEDPISVDAISACLWDKDTDSMVTGSELVWASEEQISRKNTEIDVANLVDGHEYEMRIKVTDNGGTGCSITADTNLYIWLDPIEQVTVWYRIAKGEYMDYSGFGDPPYIADDSRTLLELPDNYQVFYENVALAWGWPDEVESQETMYYELVDLGTANYGLDYTAVPNTKLTWTEEEATNWVAVDEWETEKIRKRSNELTLTNLHHYAQNQANGEDWLYQQQAFLIAKSNF